MRRLMQIVLVASLAALGGATLAHGHGADTASMIHACTTTENNPILLAPSTGGCTRGESALDWNISGPSGPAGPQGQQGPQGPQGPTGPQGPGGGSPVYKVVKLGQSYAFSDPKAGYSKASAYVNCPKGWVAVNGGYLEEHPGPTPVEISENRPKFYIDDPTATPVGWIASIIWPKGNLTGVSVTAYAICLKVT